MMRRRATTRRQYRRRPRRRRDFMRIGGDSNRKSWDKQHQHHRNPILGFLARLVWYSKQTTKDDEHDNFSASPDRTALMSFEELSSSGSSASSSSSSATLDKFPSWHSFSMATTAPEDKVSAPPSPIRPVVEDPPRRLRPWRRLRGKRRPSPRNMQNDDDDDDDSEHFSISTDLRQQQRSSNIQITISNSFNSYIPPSQPTPQQQRVSLETFMAENLPNTSAYNIVPLHLDNGSVDAASALLGVSYDEEYPQLVLQASLDGQRTVDSGPSHRQLGAQYTHPAAAVSPESRATQETATVANELCSPRWLEQGSMEDLWGGTQWIDDDATSTSSLREPPMTMSEWMDEAVAEFSIGDSVRSLSELIEKDVVQPVMDFCAGGATMNTTTATKKRKKILFRIIKRR